MTVYFPFEILTAIFEQVDDARDLYHVRTATRTLCAAATPLAFRVLSLTSTAGSAKNLGRLFDVPDIAAHVREITYRDTGADRRGKMQNLKRVRTKAIPELAILLSRLHQLPRLETINLTFFPPRRYHLDPDGPGRYALQASILGALAASFSVRAPSNLTSLSLYNLRTLDLSLLESPPFQNALTSLKRLQLSVLYDRATGPGTAYASWLHFWSTMCSSTVLSPTQHSLTELTLHSDVHVGASSGVSLRALHFPHLRALSLGRLVFDPSVGAERFILRHAATLMELELFKCMLPIEDRYSFPTQIQPPSTILTRNEEFGLGYTHWARIWDCFAAELAVLVALHVNAGSERHYVYPLSPMPFPTLYERRAPAHFKEADVAALQRFHVVVAARLEAGGSSRGSEGGP